MNILHISTPTTWRGGEQQLAYIIEELQKHTDVEQHVFTPRSSKIEAFCQQHNICCHTYSPKIPAAFAVCKLLHTLKKHHIDLMHAHDGHAAGLVALANLLGSKTPAILHRRVDFPVKGNLFSSYKYNHVSVAAIICVSNTVRNILLPTLKQPKKATVVYSCIETSRFEKATNTHTLHQLFHLPEDAILIGNVAALADHKDYFTFVDTAEKALPILPPNAYFIAIGDGPLKNEIQQYIEKKNLQDRVLFTGFRTDVPNLLQELNIFLITSKTEGLGTSILDAFASKTPVIATNAGGIGEIVLHNQTGLLAPVGDSQTLANYVVQLLNNPELQQKLIEGGKQKVAEFSKTILGEKVYHIYQQVLQQRN